MRMVNWGFYMWNSGGHCQNILVTGCGSVWQTSFDGWWVTNTCRNVVSRIPKTLKNMLSLKHYFWDELGDENIIFEPNSLTSQNRKQPLRLRIEQLEITMFTSHCCRLGRGTMWFKRNGTCMMKSFLYAYVSFNDIFFADLPWHILKVLYGMHCCMIFESTVS